MSLLPFDHQPRTRLVFGNGALARVGELAREFGGSRVLIVSDPGIVKAGYVARARSFLQQAGLQVHVYGEVRENPSTEDVDLCVAVARDFQTDFIMTTVDQSRDQHWIPRSGPADPAAFVTK